MSQHVLSLKNVTIYQEAITILTEVNLEVNHGEFLYIIGKTGSGKSSLMKTLYADLPMTEGEGSDEFDEEILHMRQLLKTKLTDLELSVRALNCLKAADVDTLGQLAGYHRHDLLKFRNFGKKSLTELDEKLESLNLSFGMDIAKYKLEKE